MQSSTAAAPLKNSALPCGCCVPCSALGIFGGKMFERPARKDLHRPKDAVEFAFLVMMIFASFVGLRQSASGQGDPNIAGTAALKVSPLKETQVLAFAETDFDLASVLEGTGEKKGALELYRVAHELEPSNSLYGFRYEQLSRKLGTVTT